MVMHLLPAALHDRLNTACKVTLEVWQLLGSQWNQSLLSGNHSSSEQGVARAVVSKETVRANDVRIEPSNTSLVTMSTVGLEHHMM
jgi:hypothetical protein